MGIIFKVIIVVLAGVFGLSAMSEPTGVDRSFSYKSYLLRLSFQTCPLFHKPFQLNCLESSSD